MADLGLLILIMAALAIGFGLGRFTHKKTVPNLAFSKNPWLKKRYVEGLTYLLKDEPDEAIDRFITDMDITEETLEVHLALGGLLRRKGEFGRAIRVHENLLSQPDIQEQYRQVSLLELGKDYYRSGLLDRAEQILQELLDQKQLAREFRKEALKSLAEIYQDTKDWLKAIDVADQLTSGKFSSYADDWRIAQSHYCCELALEAYALKQEGETRRWLKAALHYDRNCIRASLLQAQFDMDAGKFPAAIVTLKLIWNHSESFSSETLAPLIQCYSALQEHEQLLQELDFYLEKNKDPRALLQFYELGLKYRDCEYLLNALSKILVGFKGMNAASELVAALCADPIPLKESFPRFQNTLFTALSTMHHYECQRCGFEGQELHWNCPSCRSWATVVLRC